MAKKEEDKKKALPPISIGSGTRGLGGFATGGSGASGAGFVALHGTKVAMMIILTTLGAGAYNVGKILAPSQDTIRVAPRIGIDRAASNPVVKQVDPRNLPMDAAASGGSGLGMVTGSLDDRSAAQKAADEAKGAGGTEPLKAPEAPAPSDPNAMAAAAAKAQGAAAPAGGDAAKSTFAKKFGALSSGLNGGTGAAFGGGVGGGVGTGFDRGLGGAKGFGSNRSIGSRNAGATAPRSSSKGKAFAQLQHSANLSRGAATSRGAEASSSQANAAFDSPGAQGAITGGGAGSQAATGAGTQTGATPSAEQNQQTTNPAPQASHTNASPWQSTTMAAIGALLIAGILLFAAQKLAAKAKALGPLLGANWLLAAQVAAGIAATLGALVIGLGFSMMKKHGQEMYGMMFIAGGGLVTAMSIGVLIDSFGEAADKTVNSKLATDGSGVQKVVDPGAANLNGNAPATGVKSVPPAKVPGPASMDGNPLA